MPHAERGSQTHPAQLQEPPSQARLLGNLSALLFHVDRKWRRRGLGKHPAVEDADLDVAVGQIGVRAPLRAPRDYSLHAHHVLGADALGHPKHVGRHGLGIDETLHEAVPVAKIEEHQPAVVAPAMHPTAERDLAPRVPDPQRSGAVGSEARCQMISQRACSAVDSTTTLHAFQNPIPTSAPTPSAIQSAMLGSRPTNDCRNSIKAP